MSLLLSTLFNYCFRAQHFSPDPAMLFSGVVACVTDVRSPRGPFSRALYFYVYFYSLFRLILKYYLLELQHLGGSGARDLLVM